MNGNGNWWVTGCVCEFHFNFIEMRLRGTGLALEVNGIWTYKKNREDWHNGSWGQWKNEHVQNRSTYIIFILSLVSRKSKSCRTYILIAILLLFIIVSDDSLPASGAWPAFLCNEYTWCLRQWGLSWYDWEDWRGGGPDSDDPSAVAIWSVQISWASHDSPSAFLLGLGLWVGSRTRSDGGPHRGKCTCSVNPSPSRLELILFDNKHNLCYNIRMYGYGKCHFMSTRSTQKNN